jgi:hypothetical protein
MIDMVQVGRFWRHASSGTIKMHRTVDGLFQSHLDVQVRFHFQVLHASLNKGDKSSGRDSVWVQLCLVYVAFMGK